MEALVFITITVLILVSAGILLLQGKASSPFSPQVSVKTNIIKKRDFTKFEKLRKSLRPDELLLYSVRAIDLINTSDSKTFAKLTNKRIDFIIIDTKGNIKAIFISDKILHDLIKENAPFRVYKIS